MKQINNGYASYYYLTEAGIVYNDKTKQYLKATPKHKYTLQTEAGSKKTVTIKTLYKLVYNRVFCIDNITDLENEIGREIEGTEQRYYISNKGRVKSYCKYNAIIVQPSTTYKGYERLQIVQNGILISKYVHTLVASAFPEDCGKPQSIDWQVHHLDGIKTHNGSNNLQGISKAEHVKIHKEERKQKGE